MNTNIFTFLTRKNTINQTVNQSKINNSAEIDKGTKNLFNEIMNDLEESSINENEQEEFINRDTITSISSTNNAYDADSDLSKEDEDINRDTITSISSTNNAYDADSDLSKEDEDINKENEKGCKDDINILNLDKSTCPTDDFNTQKNLQIGIKSEDDLKYNLEHKSNINIDKTEDLNESQNLDFEKSMLIEDDNENYNSEINDNEYTLIENYEEDLISSKSTFEEELLKASKSEELSKNILKQIDSGLKNSSTPRNINIILKPQQLGNVNVKIKFTPTGMHIEIIVDNDVTQDAIMSNLSKLEHIISPNNDLNIASINISQRKEIQIKEKQSKEYSLELKKQENIINSKRVNPIFYKKHN